MQHFRAMFSSDNAKDKGFFTFLHGETIEDINTQVNEIIEEERQENGTAYQVDLQPITTEELVKEKECDLKMLIERIYLDTLTNPRTTIREYMNLKKNPDTYWQALDYFMTKIRTEKILQKEANLEKISVKQYNIFLEKLIRAKTMNEYMAIIEKVKTI